MQSFMQLHQRVVTLEALIRKYHAPDRPAGHLVHIKPGGLPGLRDDITCHFDYRGGRMELKAAYLCGLDITTRLTEDDLSQLKAHALGSIPQEA